MKKTIVIFAACFFLNSALYSPGFAIESYITQGGGFEYLQNKLNLSAGLKKYPSLQLLAQLAAEANANPNLFEAKAFIQDFNDSGVTSKIDLEKLQFFLNKLKETESADTKTLLIDSKIIIGDCIEQIDSGAMTPLNALLLAGLKNIDNTLAVILHNNSGINYIGAAVPDELSRSTYNLCASVIKLYAIISIYGVGISVPATISEMWWLSLAIACLYDVLDLMYGIEAPANLFYLMAIIGLLSKPVYYFYIILNGQFDIIFVNWLLVFIDLQIQKVIFPANQTVNQIGTSHFNPPESPIHLKRP